MRSSVFILLAFFSVLAINASPAKRNQILTAARQGEKSISTLTAALEDHDYIVRRTAVRELACFKEKSEKALANAALNNSDHVTRRCALAGLASFKNVDELLDTIESIIRNESSQDVRKFAIELLTSVRPAAGRRAVLLAEAAKDTSSQEINELISRAAWPYWRRTTLLRERRAWDSPVETVAATALPSNGWKFIKDPERNLHLRKCFMPGDKLAGWRPIVIGKFWEHSIGAYDGVGWYKLEFKAPEKPGEYNAVELAFGAVDEVAWVWLNGIYIGQHDIGKSGWNIPFSLDITGEIKWGEKNHLAVRVFDSSGAGGIWKPIKLVILN